ncbi:MAG: PAS domain S-box protein [Deltaproteobacteria bacterium]|nr:PAS domain S-box protein [Deltaproteobacteria bacterium]
MPHGHCYFWRPEILWLHVGSDALIALAYYSIPLALISIVRKRRDLVYHWMFLLFASFIFLCGTTHLVSIWSTWNGTYRFEGAVKLLTALVSVATAAVLWPLIPKIIAIPSRRDLQDEIAMRRAAQGQLEKAQTELEDKVRKRTNELELVNARLSHWAKIIDSSDDGIISLSLEGLITSWNRAAERIFGYRAIEIIGRPIDELMDEERAAEFGQIRDIVASGDPFPDHETAWQRRGEGQVLVSLTVSPLMNHKTSLVDGFSIIVRDVTDRKRQEERFRIAVEAAPNAMLLVNPEGKIVLANAQSSHLFGYSNRELMGADFEMLIPGGALQGVEGEENSLNGHKTGSTRKDYSAVRKNGRSFPVEVGHTPIETSEGSMVISAVVDMTSHREAQERIQSSLEQKELLLKEVHHRVKNNLQVISSLLKIQSGYLSDPQAKAVLRESEDRVRSMALVHERLYRSAELNRVEFKSYVEQLANELRRTYCLNEAALTLDMELDEIDLNIEKAIPCGLILNELISNALKHAFRGFGEEYKRRVKISVKRASSPRMAFEMTVADNGRGLPDYVDLQHPKSMGLRVVRTLCEQLKGTLEVTRENGTVFRLNFAAKEELNAVKEGRDDDRAGEHTSV